MNELLVSFFVQGLTVKFESEGPAIFNLSQELESLSNPMTGNKISKEELNEIKRRLLEKIAYKQSYENSILIPVSSINDPKLHEEWYNDWLQNNDNLTGGYYWKRLEYYLSSVLSKKIGAANAGEIVKSIDDATLHIIEQLANPLRKEFSYKGLVVGYVQSGKTANFTALIAKAADAGYRLIIVLSGIHSVLRRQTQIRLDKELTGMNDLGLDEDFIEEPSQTKIWTRLTTASVKKSKTRKGTEIVRDLGEFENGKIDPFESICKRRTPTIAIVKKNVKILDKLLQYFTKAKPSLRDEISVLLIDDEADQASVDGNANTPDSDPTRTNEKIRAILALFSRKAYVGYTATPFANVLIDMKSNNNSLQDDLYPRNFIVSLPEPTGYFGTRKIFQSNISENIVQEIIDGDAERKLFFDHGHVSSNLSNSIDCFIIGCAIRNLRKDRVKPMSMLIHVSHTINDMQILYNIVSRHVDLLKGRYADKKESVKLRQEFQKVWLSYHNDSETINTKLSTKNKLFEFLEIWKEIESVLNKISILELNSTSEDRLDYNSGEEIKIIAIGGNQLSRGLTLEGLMISYYLRASNQYDTLLQMGRWFGYRQNYEDLTRIFTTTSIWSNFEHLALVEDELRTEIYRYEEEGKTPAELAVAIRCHETLSITAPNKMGAGKLKQSSFSGMNCQTFRVPLDQPAVLEFNLNLGNGFIKDIDSKFKFKKNKATNSFTAFDIPGNIVKDEFLKKYQIVKSTGNSGPGLDYSGLLKYIGRRLNNAIPELTKWNISVISNKDAANSPRNTKFGGLPINKISRSRKSSSEGYNIGVLTEPEHLDMDISPNSERNASTGHLLLYVIDKESKATRKPKTGRKPTRIDLFDGIKSEKVDVLGIAIQLPKSKQEPNNYIGQI